MKLRMMGDRLLVKPLDVEWSKIVAVVTPGRRTFRGVVVAVGPGTNPKKYKAGPKGPRSLMDYSKRFQPTEVKPGDVVEFGGLNVFDGQGYQFHEEWIDGVKHVIMHEGDVAGVEQS